MGLSFFLWWEVRSSLPASQAHTVMYNVFYWNSMHFLWGLSNENCWLRSLEWSSLSAPISNFLINLINLCHRRLFLDAFLCLILSVGCPNIHSSSAQLPLYTHLQEVSAMNFTCNMWTWFGMAVTFLWGIRFACRRHLYWVFLAVYRSFKTHQQGTESSASINPHSSHEISRALLLYTKLYGFYLGMSLFCIAS